MRFRLFWIPTVYSTQQFIFKYPCFVIGFAIDTNKHQRKILNVKLTQEILKVHSGRGGKAAHILRLGARWPNVYKAAWTPLFVFPNYPFHHKLARKSKFCCLSQAITSYHPNVFACILPLSEGRVGKAWEPSKKVTLFLPLK
jgi:hypothetical protein